MTTTGTSNAKQFAETMAQMDHPLYQFLVENGEHFGTRTPVKTVPIAKEWGKRNKPKSGQCYMNAQKFAWDHPEAKYYEGYWFLGTICVWHGWIVLDGKVIDHTAEACERGLKRDGIEMSPPENQDYFGVHIPTEAILKIAMKTKVWGDILGRYVKEQS